MGDLTERLREKLTLSALEEVEEALEALERPCST
jgi:hypothetical protein